MPWLHSVYDKHGEQDSISYCKSLVIHLICFVQKYKQLYKLAQRCKVLKLELNSFRGVIHSEVTPLISRSSAMMTAAFSPIAIAVL